MRKRKTKRKIIFQLNSTDLGRVFAIRRYWSGHNSLMFSSFPLLTDTQFMLAITKIHNIFAHISFKLIFSYNCLTTFVYLDHTVPLLQFLVVLFHGLKFPQMIKMNMHAMYVFKNQDKEDLWHRWDGDVPYELLVCNFHVVESQTILRSVMFCFICSLHMFAFATLNDKAVKWWQVLRTTRTDCGTVRLQHLRELNPEPCAR